jgi:hypothetical protein
MAEDLTETDLARVLGDYYELRGAPGPEILSFTPGRMTAHARRSSSTNQRRPLSPGEPEEAVASARSAAAGSAERWSRCRPPPNFAHQLGLPPRTG